MFAQPAGLPTAKRAHSGISTATSHSGWIARHSRATSSTTLRQMTDQGPEFTGQALDQWAEQNRVELILIQPSKPTQNAFIESFNGKLRDECLNEHWFANLYQARALIAHRRTDYNERRPHSSLDSQTPAAFRTQQRQPTAHGE